MTHETSRPTCWETMPKMRCANTSWPEPFVCSCKAATPPGGAVHTTHGTHPENTQISGTVLGAVRSLTRVDQLVHATAMARLGRDLKALNLTCLLTK